MAIKNFSRYLIEAEREVFFTFGRMNPPTIGHGKVLETLAKKSGRNDYKVFTLLLAEIFIECVCIL